MTVTAGCEGDGISLGNAVNTQYYEKLGAGKTLEVPVEIQTDKKTEAGKYKLTLELSYDNPDAVTLTATGQIEITIEQKSELTMEIGQIPEEVKEERQAGLMELQQDIVFDQAEDRIGEELLVMIEGKVADENAYVGRTYRDAPNVDGLIFVNTSEELMSGDFAKVKVTGAADYDLIGELL